MMASRALLFAFASWVMMIVGLPPLFLALDMEYARLGGLGLAVATGWLNIQAIRRGGRARQGALSLQPVDAESWARGTLARVFGTFGLLGTLVTFLLVLVSLMPIVAMR